LRRYDAIIAGGGVAGSTAARILARGGWSVLVVEKSSFPRKKVCGEYLSSTNLALFDQLGLLDDFLSRAGPEINRVGLFDRSTVVTSPMPRPRRARFLWGRALRREILDPLLLERAVEAGAEVRQPWSVVGTERRGNAFVSKVVSQPGNDADEVESRVVVAAHGSWETGSLPTQSARLPPRGSDLFGFKAHFENAALPQNLMPLVVFPGGYGGMVNCGDGLLSLSFCIRRDRLESLRRHSPHAKAGEAAYAHILDSCVGVREALSDAVVRDGWASAGPIRPGIRPRYRDGIYCIGNAAGEAHPLIAEGISIAMQSAWLLARRLAALPPGEMTEADLQSAGRRYAGDWLNSFGLRIKAAEVFARLAMTGGRTHALILPVLLTFPQILTAGARISGKVNQVVKLNEKMALET
jgi:flavin-dependent dehydrogenase